MTSYPEHVGHGGRGPGDQMVRPQPKNGPGTAALVLGIIALGTGWVPFVGFAGFLCGLVGVGLGIAGIYRANTGRATNRTAAIVGLVLSIIGIIVSIVVFSATMNAVSTAVGTPPAVSSGASVVVPPAAYPTLPPVPPAPSGPLTEIPTNGGVFEVGTDIVPGKYKTEGPAGFGCYYARLQNNDGSLRDIIDNNNTDGPATVTIKESDGYFETSGCKPWVKTG